jgi:hypothetical protein
MTSVARALGAGVGHHTNVRLLHVCKGAVGLAVMAFLAGPVSVNASKKLVAVAAGDDDLFPSFQLGYFAASALCQGNFDDVSFGAGKCRLQFCLARVAPNTGYRINNRWRRFVDWL